MEKDTLGDYPETVRALSREQNVALIDLHWMSKALYQALGDAVGQAFVDGTHHNNYGSYELARCVVEGIRAARLPLAEALRSDLPPFDPAYPDALAEFGVPFSPQRDPAKPEGK